MNVNKVIIKFLSLSLTSLVVQWMEWRVRRQAKRWVREHFSRINEEKRRKIQVPGCDEWGDQWVNEWMNARQTRGWQTEKALFGHSQGLTRVDCTDKKGRGKMKEHTVYTVHCIYTMYTLYTFSTLQHIRMTTRAQSNKRPVTAFYRQKRLLLSSLWRPLIVRPLSFCVQSMLCKCPLVILILCLSLVVHCDFSLFSSHQPPFWKGNRRLFTQTLSDRERMDASGVVVVLDATTPLDFSKQKITVTWKVIVSSRHDIRGEIRMWVESILAWDFSSFARENDIARWIL